MNQNIEQTKEYKLAKTVEAALNSYSFNPKVFAASIPMMHPTNQQSLYRLLRECLRVMADDSETEAVAGLRKLTLID